MWEKTMHGASNGCSSALLEPDGGVQNKEKCAKSTCVCSFVFSGAGST